MVEFELKLEDNKVADWTDYYIQYGKLKAILAKCSASLKRLNSLQEKRPQVAASIIENYNNGILATPDSSQQDLYALADSATNSTETTKLTTTSDRSSGGGGYGGVVERVDSQGNLLSRAFGKAASGVTDYFAKSYAKAVREALLEIDKHLLEYDVALKADIQTVNEFYQETLDELEGRVRHLKESVLHIQKPSTAEEEAGPSDESERPLIQKPSRGESLVVLANKFKRNFAGRISQIPLLQSESFDFDDHPASTRRTREIESIQRALMEHYRTAKLLHNYAIMNYTGFVKICKKFNKTVPSHKNKYKETIRPENICHEGQAVELLAGRMEQLYATWFCERNVSEARAQLLSKKGDGLEMDWSQLRLGYRMGMCTILGLWVAWDCIWGLYSEGHTTIGGRSAFPVFRGCAGLLMLQWCWGCSVWVWTRYRVNYIFLFDFNPSIVASPLAIFNEAVNNTLAYLVLTLLYYKAGAHDIPGTFPPGVFPFVLVLYTVVQLIFPLRVRAPMWRSIWHVITSPMASPTFFQGYVGDIFTSLVKVFQDLAWTFLFVLSGSWMDPHDLNKGTKHIWSRNGWYTDILIPLLTLLPLWFRFNQCLRRYTDTQKRFPHLANAFKYALSQTVTLFGAFHPLYMRNKKESELFQAFWMFAFVASSLYSFCWDVYQDWGLGQWKHKMLGPRLMFPSRTMYYGIICVDLVLRFAWVLTLLPPDSGAKFALPAYLTLVSMMLEIFRRTIWGFLRLENEHRSNTAGFRRVGFVPLHFTTGHAHGYKQEGKHRGVYVLFEVLFITILVLGAAVVSVVAAQHATQRAVTRAGEL